MWSCKTKECKRRDHKLVEEIKKNMRKPNFKASVLALYNYWRDRVKYALLSRNLFQRPATLLKKRLWHRRFPVNFAKFLRPPFLKNTSRRLFCSIHRTLLNSLGMALRSCDSCLLIFILYSSFLNFILTYLFLAGLVYFVVVKLFSVL